MTPRLDHGADFIEMLFHREAVAKGHDKSGALARFWTDSSKDISPFRALVFRRGRPGSAPCPSPRDFILLTDARLVLEPKLYGCALGEGGLDFRYSGREVFLKASRAYSFCPWCFGRAESLR